MTKPQKTTATILILTIIITATVSLLTPRAQDQFNGKRASGYIAYQISLGSRAVGNRGHEEIISWLMQELEKYGWETSIEHGNAMGHPIKNVIGRRGKGDDWIILGTHYDTRPIADQDADITKHTQPVPGANDGASGVAVLLELARVMPENLDKEIWLVFFDAEDNGDIPGWDWILGSRFFVNSLQDKPDAVVIIDMIGDSDLNIHRELNSTDWLADEIWATAASLGYSEVFIDQPKYSIIDDHTPFLSAGIPAVDIIDFDYPYWHTTEDKPDKISATSLQIVGEVLLKWLERNGIEGQN